MTLAIGLSGLLLALAVHLLLGLSFPELTRDMTVVAGIHPLCGVLSNLGILLWCVSAAACGIAALVSWGRLPARMVGFLAASALFAAYLTLDDLFLLHEKACTILGGLGGEFAVYAVLGMLFSAYLIAFRQIILLTDRYLLALTVLTLGAAVAVDLLQEQLLSWGPWRNLIEDGFKWLGIASWCGYLCVTAWSFMEAATMPVLDPSGTLAHRTRLRRVHGLLFMVPALLVLLGITGAGAAFDVPFGSFTKDVASIGRVHQLTGMLSNLGILLWCVAATVSAITAARSGHRLRTGAHGFLLASAALSSYLLLDDLFLFHEDLSYRYFGIRERYVMLCLGSAMLCYLWYYRKVILTTRHSYLLAALCCFAGSVVVDGLLRPWHGTIGDGVALIEDGLKWLGIVCWASYHMGAALQFWGAWAERITAPPTAASVQGGSAPRGRSLQVRHPGG